VAKVETSNPDRTINFKGCTAYLRNNNNNTSCVGYINIKDAVVIIIMMISIKFAVAVYT
jgi:hypothetical protein